MSPRINDLRRSRFLTQGDILEPTLVTIKSYEEVNVGTDNEPEIEWAVRFDELEKPLVLNVTNGQLIGAIFGVSDEELLEKKTIGKQIVLFVDPTVSYAGKITGGIRVRASRRPQPTTNIPENYEEPISEEPPSDDIPF